MFTGLDQIDWASIVRLGDARALPLIRRALEEDLRPPDCRPPLWAYRNDGALLVPLVPLMLRQIQRAIAAGAVKEAQDLLSDLTYVGPDAAPMVPALKASLDSARWPEMILATLWRITGDAETALTALAEHWRHERHSDFWTVRCWTDMGPAAASMEPLPREELANPVRATCRPNSRGGADIENDEKYQAEFRVALEAVTGTPAYTHDEPR